MNYVYMESSRTVGKRQRLEHRGSVMKLADGRIVMLGSFLNHFSQTIKIKLQL